MKWRNGMKLIIHIADAGAHGTEFSSGDNYPGEGPKLEKLIKECVDKDINIIGFKTDEDAEQSFEKMSEIYNQYKMSGQNKDKGQFIEIYDFNKNSSEKKGGEDPVSEMFHHIVIEAANQVVNPSYKYLKRLKNILNLPNDLEKDIKDLKSLISILNIGSDNYVITEDNYKKMILLVYRIKANVPVIIMGETGCGKTSLIKKLSQILNNGEELVEIINIHPGITDEQISSRMIEINEVAKKSEYINKEKNIKKELWVFFDEINTCLSLSLLTEIFINRTFNGEKLEKNIRLIGACNPYRRRVFAAEKCGLTREDDKDDDLVYKVEQLPQSLLYYVFSFGTIQDSDEKKYIQSIIQKLFNKEEENLHKLTTEAISKCHKFLRKIFKDPSIVSLREIARFRKCVEFFQNYFIYKSNKKVYSINSIGDETKKLYKIKSIICSIYLCYYIRLINEEIRGKFDSELQETILKIVNVYSNEKSDEGNKTNLFDKIRNKKLKDELSNKNIEHFSDLLRIEEEFLLTKVELAPGIGKNESLKENLFLLFLAVVTKIPLIIVGKPGTGKSLSAQLIYNSMRGIYSKNEFFKNYPSIIQIYFQGSDFTEPEDVSEVFKKAENLYENFKRNKNSNDKVPIFMILFDELGLAEKSPTNPLKVLHSKLEYDGKNEGVCFVGISNYSLDAAKINRALSLSVPNLEDRLDQLKATSKGIVESISKEIAEEPSKIFVFNILSRAYYLYKQILNFIKKLIVLKKFLKKNENF
jgi:broad-specificity NMP kinase